MEKRLEIIFTDVETRAATLLATGEWYLTTSNGTYNGFVRYLMLTDEGKAFNRKFNYRGESAFLEHVKTSCAHIREMLIVRKLLTKQGIPINIEDKVPEFKKQPAYAEPGYAANRARMFR